MLCNPLLFQDKHAIQLTVASLRVPCSIHCPDKQIFPRTYTKKQIGFRQGTNTLHLLLTLLRVRLKLLKPR